MTHAQHPDADHQYELDRITAQYSHEYHAGHAPSIEDYIQRYPQHAAELLDFWLYFHCVAVDLPEPGLQAATELSPAAQAALARIREEV